MQNYTYFRAVTFAAPNEEQVSVADPKSETAAHMPIDEVVRRAGTDGMFRRLLKYPDAMSADVQRAINSIVSDVRDYMWKKLVQLHPDIQVAQADEHLKHVCNSIRRAMDEACKNAFWHAHHGDPRTPFQLSAAIPVVTKESEERVVIELADMGAGFDLSSVPTPEQVWERNLETGQEGGLGVSALIREGMDETTQSPVPEGSAYRHILRMTKYLFKGLSSASSK